MNHNFFPPEWFPQSAVQLTWPHQNTDWADIWDEVQECYKKIAFEIAKRQKLIIAAQNVEEVKSYVQHCNLNNIEIYQCDVNDTWARDHGGITILENGKPVVLDFQFNGWGKKFAAEKDSAITQKLYDAKAFPSSWTIKDLNHIVLEGGSLEVDGQGVLMTTSECLLEENRNPQWTITEIEKLLKELLHVEKVIWINHGYLAGDDTDSHIDTLARFCNENTIAYVKCDDPNDEHYSELSKMEEELQRCTNLQGEKYKLVALPMADAAYDDDGERLPATYANFLIMNDAILFPIYNSSKDAEALKIMQSIFPDKEIISINSVPLIKQHGSIHCISMQYPKL
ncbi:MAG: agmatine deiminase family protein [Bacteroidetes bacterium]|nr:agmatine deiminase family protein [Bacteroidota bacterium]